MPQPSSAVSNSGCTAYGGGRLQELPFTDRLGLLRTSLWPCIVSPASLFLIQIEFNLNPDLIVNPVCRVPANTEIQALDVEAA